MKITANTQIKKERQTYEICAGRSKLKVKGERWGLVTQSMDAIVYLLSLLVLFVPIPNDRISLRQTWLCW